MALSKLVFKPGINKEITALSAKGQWVDGDKVRFREGFPEKIGGWQRLSTQTFLGTCRGLFGWATRGAVRLLGIGTNLKYYIASGGAYYDITPIRASAPAGGVTFSATTGSPVITVTDVAHGANAGDFVTYSGAVSLGGAITAAVLNKEYQVVAVLTVDSYTINAGVNATAGDSGNGGAVAAAAYQIHIGSTTTEPIGGWGAGPWGGGAWGIGLPSLQSLRLWSHANYGEDLLFGPRGGPIYYWDSSVGTGSRGVLVSGNDTPVVQNGLIVSDVSRFVIALGANEIGGSAMDPMLVRWSAQEQYDFWTPAVTNQAGGQPLSNGSRIVMGLQNRQEILIWTDTGLYSMQYQGPPTVWGFQLMGENTSIISPQAAAVANGTAYWMGQDKFYMYDGRVQTLPCSLRRYIFEDINAEQLDQIVCGTNEGFSEIWWHYPSSGSATNNRYVIYNYLQGIWYHGTLTRTAWFDSALYGHPVAAVGNTIVEHEVGVDANTNGLVEAIPAYITSAPVDLGDGGSFTLINRVLPDMTFEGSTSLNPQATFELLPAKNAGSGYKSPRSVAGISAAPVVRSAAAPVEMFTEQLNIRVRGRQISLQVRSDAVGTMWQLGTPRVDGRPDGQRG